MFNSMIAFYTIAGIFMLWVFFSMVFSVMGCNEFFSGILSAIFVIPFILACFKKGD